MTHSQRRDFAIVALGCAYLLFMNDAHDALLVALFWGYGFFCGLDQRSTVPWLCRWWREVMHS